MLKQFFHGKKVGNFKIDEIKLQITGEVIDPNQSVQIE